MSMAELVRRHEEGRLPKDAAAVTFDDGYASNLHLAKPILEGLDSPATVFVVSGFLDSATEPWSDELGSLFLGETVLPEVVQCTIGGVQHEWRARNWSSRRREAAYRQIHGILVTKPVHDRLSAVRAIGQQVQVLRQQEETARRPLTTEELIRLADGGIIEVGAHTVSHPSLPCLGATEQRQEIASSKIALQSRLKLPVLGFAYPYGDHNMTSVSILSDLGFSYACTTARGFVHVSDGRFQLPRFAVEDWDGEEFTRRFAPRKTWLHLRPARN
jgi:peptidoglycan/xylan/chitin deacetylase (PgdA/CDA1 family)